MTQNYNTVSRKSLEDSLSSDVIAPHEAILELPKHLDEGWETNSSFFKALGDKNRLKLLYLLRDGEKCVSDLLPYFDILQPTVSTHLLMLEETGILKVRRDGRRRFYSISDPGIYEVLDYFVEELTSLIKE